MRKGLSFLALSSLKQPVNYCCLHWLRKHWPGTLGVLVLTATTSLYPFSLLLLLCGSL